ncbi:hypothetical protein ACOSP7_004848 [Xanthoceras sorbifolium]
MPEGATMLTAHLHHHLSFTTASPTVRTKLRSAGLRRDVKWEPPDVGVFKVNTDVALSVRDGAKVIGVVIRDSAGHVMASCA